MGHDAARVLENRAAGSWGTGAKRGRVAGQTLQEWLRRQQRQSLSAFALYNVDLIDNYASLDRGPCWRAPCAPPATFSAKGKHWDPGITAG